MDWWFNHDYTTDDCIGLGGKEYAKPCAKRKDTVDKPVMQLVPVVHLASGTPLVDYSVTLFIARTDGQNWFGQVILIPQLSSTACLLLSEELYESQLQGCIRIPSRAYDRRDQFINSLGYLTGANVSRRMGEKSL